MMIAAVVGVGQLALAVDRAAELAAPDDQRVVEQAALLEVGDSAAVGWSVPLHCSARSRGRSLCWSQPRW